MFGPLQGLLLSGRRHRMPERRDTIHLLPSVAAAWVGNPGAATKKSYVTDCGKPYCVVQHSNNQKVYLPAGRPPHGLRPLASSKLTSPARTAVAAVATVVAVVPVAAVAPEVVVLGRAPMEMRIVVAAAPKRDNLAVVVEEPTLAARMRLAFLGCNLLPREPVVCAS